MRKFILIAGFVLASASAYGGDRSLSLSGVEAQSAPAPAKTIDAPRTAEAPPPVADTPKYTERPAIVEPKAENPKADTTKTETTRGETPRVETQRALSPRPAAMAGRYAAQRSHVAPGRHSFRRSASMHRGMRPHRSYRLARIIHTLHRYGIYW